MSCDCGPILKSLSAEQLAQLKNHIISTANKRSISLGVNMDATHTHELNTLTATTVAEASKPVEVAVAAVSADATTKTEPAKTEVQVEMVAKSEKTAIEVKLTEKEAEFVAFAAASAAIKLELDAAKAASAIAAETVARLTGELQAASGKVTELTGQLTAVTNNVAEYQKVLDIAIPQELLSEAVLKSASGIVDGYDGTKTVSEQTPATIVKLLKFSETVKQAAQSTNAGAVETSATKKAKKPDMNLVFRGITINQKNKKE